MPYAMHLSSGQDSLTSVGSSNIGIKLGLIYRRFYNPCQTRVEEPPTKSGLSRFQGCSLCFVEARCPFCWAKGQPKENHKFEVALFDTYPYDQTPKLWAMVMVR